MKMLRSLLALFAALILAAPACAYYVNGTTVGGTATSTTATTSSAISVTSGNLIVVFLAWSDNAGHTINVSTINDSAGNTYVAGTKSTNSGNGSGQMFYALNATGGSVTVTVTLNTATTYRSLGVWQYSNIAASSAFDFEVTPAVGSSTTAATGTFSTTQANEVVIAPSTIVAPATAGSGYTMRATVNYVSNQDQYFASATSGLLANETSGTSATWNIHAMVFKLASTESPINIARNNAAVFYSPYTWNDNGMSANANTTGAYSEFSFRP